MWRAGEPMMRKILSLESSCSAGRGRHSNTWDLRMLAKGRDTKRQEGFGELGARRSLTWPGCSCTVSWRNWGLKDDKWPQSNVYTAWSFNKKTIWNLNLSWVLVSLQKDPNKNDCLRFPVTIHSLTVQLLANISVFTFLILWLWS